MNKVVVKVCGMREGGNIREVESLGPDWMGFIFYSKSPRFVKEEPSYLPSKAKRVGVFVDADLEYIARTTERFDLDLVQLHGNESPEMVLRLRNALPNGIQIIKAFNVAASDDLRHVSDYEGVANYFLFDTKASLAGGNGSKFNWEVLAGYQGKTPFFLSGGIGPEDALAVRSFSHPSLYGVDLNSRFESVPAVKDIALLKHFLNQLKQ